jgi:hypothetical protein
MKPINIILLLAIFYNCETIYSETVIGEIENFEKATTTTLYRLPFKYSTIIISNPRNIQRIRLRKNQDYLKLRRVTIVKQNLSPDVLSVFAKIEMLEMLKLSNNNIHCDIDLGTLSKLNALTTLNLNMNHINIVRNLEDENSYVYQSLKIIDLSSNDIAYISIYVFEHMKSLDTLLLYGNKLFRVAFLSVIHTIIPSLDTLSLNDNGFLCSDLNTDFPNTTLPKLIWAHEENCKNRLMDDIYMNSKAVCCYGTKKAQLTAYPLNCCDKLKLELSENLEEIEQYTNILSIINTLDFCTHSCSIGNGLNGNLLLHI